MNVATNVSINGISGTMPLTNAIELQVFGARSAAFIGGNREESSLANSVAPHSYQVQAKIDVCSPASDEQDQPQATHHCPLPLQEFSPVVRRAIWQSKRRSRQIWVIWIGSRIALRNAYRLGRGTLIARIIGDEIFLSTTLTEARLSELQAA